MGREALELLADTFRNDNADEPARMAALGQLLGAYSSELSLATADHRLAGELVYALLSPFAERAIRRAASHLPLHQRDDFVASALSHIFVSRNRQGVPRICSFDVTGARMGRLVCWLERVALRLLQSVRRSSRRRPHTVGLPETQICDAPGPEEIAAAREQFWIAPLSRADLDALAEVPAKLRVRLLAVTGAWLRVPPDTWEKWLSRYEATCEVSLARPCPPASLLRSDNVNQFFQGLAASLQTTVGTLNGVRYHQIPRFREVLDYLGGAGDPNEADRRMEDAGLSGERR